MKLREKGKHLISVIKGKLPKRFSINGLGLLALLVVCTTAIVAGIARTYAVDMWTIDLDSNAPGGVTEVFKEIKMFPKVSPGDPNVGLVAPGFSNDYHFKVKNSNPFGVKCTTLVNVDFINPTSIPDTDFPLQATFTDIEDTKTSVLTLDGKSDVVALGKGGTGRDTKEYAFNWSWDYNGGNDALDTAWGSATGDVMIKVTIKVVAEQSEFTVYYNSAGGTSCSPVTIQYGDPLGTLPTTTRPGYTFAGWVTDSGTLVTNNTVLAPDGGSVTLTARWSYVPRHDDDDPDPVVDPDPVRFTLPTTGGSITGNWNLIDESQHLWTFTTSYGELLKDGWYRIYNPYTKTGKETQWFSFDENGFLEYGWIKEKDHDWYYGHSISDGDLGAREYGWHHDEDDGYTYYLDEETGLMQSGWQLIGGYYYYFTKLEEVPRATWNYQGIRRNGIRKWIYQAIGLRPYGSMYRSERTPDGYMVDEYGRWCINGVPQTENFTVKKLEHGCWIKNGERDWYHATFTTKDGIPIYDKGWYYDDQDKRTYYMDPETGLMWSGWHVINGYWYYFTTYEEVPYSTWGAEKRDESGYLYWEYKETGQRSYGSMYQNEVTPDGYTVDMFGRYCENGVPVEVKKEQ